MSLTSRKPRPLDRGVPYQRDTRLIIIATEGRKTEEQYFNIFRDTRIQVKVLSTGEDNRSAPNHVIDRLNSFKEEYQISNNDELWLMVDVDQWGDRNLSQIVQEASQRTYGLAVSNPCFEVWLLCHYETPKATLGNCQSVEGALKNTLGGSYNKSNLDRSFFSGRVASAIQNAKNLDGNSNDRWPQAIGTHVYKVVNSIQGLNPNTIGVLQRSVVTESVAES